MLITFYLACRMYAEHLVTLPAPATISLHAIAELAVEFVTLTAWIIVGTFRSVR